jgi:hypothetical protein
MFGIEEKRDATNMRRDALSGIRRAWVPIFCAQAKSDVRSSGSRKGVFRVGSVRVWHGVVLCGETRKIFLYGCNADHGDDGLVCC